MEVTSWSIVWLFVLGLVSPGPDFALVLRNSLTSHRRVAILTAFGITCGVAVHTLFSVYGISRFIAQTPNLVIQLRTAGAVYLIFLGYKTLKNRGDSPEKMSEVIEISAVKAFFQGFFSNVLNIKVGLFYLSLFSPLFAENVEHNTRLMVALILVIFTALWFCGLAIFLTQERLKHWMFQLASPLYLISGLSLITFGVLIIVAM